MKLQIKSLMENVKTKFIRSIKRNKKGGSLIETIVIIAVISGLCFVTLSSIGGSVKQNSTSAVKKMDDLVKVSDATE